ncbi:LLM class flavin-dependent oxidoreductase [Nonomuraea sp. N2-4H]|uniref:LLM class flavin-dependent oxidoreductase n=1 Tax=Nonomuraea sp. N2-4H TaxID=3128898 RepID=UPI0032470A81
MSTRYGHSLRLGLLLTGTDRDSAAELARLGEELGYDLIAVHDRPATPDDHDRPSGLDPWTLLSWVAGRTGRITLAALTRPAVAPAQPAATAASGPVLPAAAYGTVPTVTGRAAASLDLLTGGRVELALAAGPGADEAAEIIRGIWSASDRSPLSHDGEHYRVPGMERGPAPAHDIPLWIAGGADPEALRLAARKADAWLLTSSPDGERGDLPATLKEANAVIDEAAKEAGRDPREIRRMVHVTGAPQASDLLPLIEEAGVGTILLATDDPEEVRRFARDTAPALRAAAQQNREAQVKSVFVRSKRHPDIDYDAIPASLAADAVEPGDPGYARVRSTYMRGGAPGLVLRPGTPEEVSEAVRYARTQPVKLSIRSGGHGISGRSTNRGGIVIDVSRMDAIEVLDKETRRVRIEPGARWGDVAAALAPHGWALSSGDYGSVGVGGLATAGGIGWFVREHGLTIDHLRAVEMVLADGTRVRADENENADLFWAVRGAGANFGIVTSFEFEVDEVGDVGFAQFIVDATDTAGLLERWGAAVEAAPRDVTSTLLIGRPQPGQPVIGQISAVVDSSDSDTIVSRLQPIAGVAPLLDYSIQVMPYYAIMAGPHGPQMGQGEPVARSGLADHLTPELAAAAEKLVRSGQTYFFQIRGMGGASSDVPPDATAYAGRSANFQLVAFGQSKRGLDEQWDPMIDHFSGLYINFETDQRPERLHEAYPEGHLRRLRELKRRYDPENVFRDNFPIEPAEPAEAAESVTV